MRERDTMGDYLLYGVELINDDSSMKAFAQSVVTNLNLHYDSRLDYDFFVEESMGLVREPFVMTSAALNLIMNI